MPIVAAFATSPAYTFQEPETWDQRRERSKTNVARKAGRPAADTIRNAHHEIRQRLARANADAVLLIGDDQAENFSEDNMPQLLVYTGCHALHCSLMCR